MANPPPVVFRFLGSALRRIGGGVDSIGAALQGKFASPEGGKGEAEEREMKMSEFFGSPFFDGRASAFDVIASFVFLSFFLFGLEESRISPVVLSAQEISRLIYCKG